MKIFLILFLFPLLSQAQNFRPDRLVLLPGNTRSFNAIAYRDSSIKRMSFGGKDCIQFQVFKEDVDADPAVDGYASLLATPFWQGSDDQTFSADFYFPSSTMAYDVTRLNLLEFHNMPDTSIGELFRIPSVNLFTERDFIFLRIWVARDRNNSTTDGKTKYISQKTFKLGRMVKDRFFNWKFHFRFSAFEDGLIQIWQDGILILDYKGANTYNDRYGLTLMFGAYKWPWYDTKSLSTIKYLKYYISNPVLKTGP